MRSYILSEVWCVSHWGKMRVSTEPCSPRRLPGRAFPCLFQLLEATPILPPMVPSTIFRASNGQQNPHIVLLCLCLFCLPFPFLRTPVMTSSPLGQSPLPECQPISTLSSTLPCNLTRLGVLRIRTRTPLRDLFNFKTVKRKP